MELLTNCFRYPDSFWILEGFAGLTMIFLKIFTQFTALFADSLRFFKTIWQLWGLYRDYLGTFWLLWLFGISWDSFEKSWYQLFLLYRYSSDSVLHVWALRGMEAIDFQVVQHSRSFFECEVYQMNCPFPTKSSTRQFIIWWSHLNKSRNGFYYLLRCRVRTFFHPIQTKIPIRIEKDELVN